ncbi:hypothetical protein LZK76_36580 (plasmid) [Rhizobium leguminosarum]|nr:hypothetical protein LZK76_36580 [Rhizobium leguminosarum]
MFQDPDYAASYKAFNVEFGAEAWADDEGILNTAAPGRSVEGAGPGLCDPVHAQGADGTAPGSMIHIRDQDFNEKAFGDAYKTHTTTSPNYQILATLDLARAQVELEGYKCVRHQLERATTLRQQVSRDPLLSKYFRSSASAISYHRNIASRMRILFRREVRLDKFREVLADG